METISMLKTNSFIPILFQLSWLTTLLWEIKPNANVNINERLGLKVWIDQNDFIFSLKNWYIKTYKNYVINIIGKISKSQFIMCMITLNINCRYFE